MFERASFPGVERCLLWLAVQAGWIVAVAWLAFHAQQDGIAPAVLFPLGVGALLGAGMAATQRMLGAPARRTALAVAVISGLLVVVGQDYIGHRRRSQLYAQELSRQGPLVALAEGDAERMQPEFAAYLSSKVGGEPLWWALDVVLTCGAAVVVVARAIPGVAARGGAVDSR